MSRSAFGPLSLFSGTSKLAVTMVGLRPSLSSSRLRSRRSARGVWTPASDARMQIPWYPMSDASRVNCSKSISPLLSLPSIMMGESDISIAFLLCRRV